MKEVKVKVTYVEELLGTAAANEQLYEDFIASNAPDAPSRKQEIEAHGVKEVSDKGKTVFPRLSENEMADMGFEPGDDVPFTWDYQWKGYFKEACGMLRNATGTKSSKFTAYKKKIDGLVFVKERKVPLVLPDGAEVGECQRPLRAETAMGPRVALAFSETVPAGTTQEFTVQLLQDNMEGILHEWLDYGSLHGTGQWRNSGKGRFTVEYL